MSVARFIEYERQDADRYTESGAWKGITFVDVLDRASDFDTSREALIERTLIANPQLRGRVILARSGDSGRFHSMETLIQDAELNAAREFTLRELSSFMRSKGAGA